MQLDALLEVAVGLIFTWLVLSLATVELQDYVGSLFSWRAKFLEQALLNMLKDPALVRRVYEEPIIRALGAMDTRGRLKKPTSLPSGSFASAFLEVIAGGGKKEDSRVVTSVSAASVRAGLLDLKTENIELARTLELVLSGLDSKSLETPDSVAKYHKNLSDWFDTVMAQASGWYKGRARVWSFIIGFVLAIIFNVDTLHITQQLWREPTLRAVIVAHAENQARAPQPEIANLTQTFEDLAIPVGWNTVPAQDSSICSWPPVQPDQRPGVYSAGECRELTNLPKWGDPYGWFLKVFGLVVTGLAAMQGAPFWFEVLRKVLSIRAQPTTAPPAEAPPPTAPPPPPAPPTLPAPPAPKPPAGDDAAG